MKLTIRLLAAGLGAMGLVACAPQVIAANPSGGYIAHVVTVGPFHDSGEAQMLADAQCRQYGKVAYLNEPLSALGGADSTLDFQCLAPGRRVQGY